MTTPGFRNGELPTQTPAPRAAPPPGLRAVPRFVRASFAVLVVFAVFAAPSCLAPPPASAEGARALRLGYVTEGWPPYIIVGGEPEDDRGIVPDLVRKAVAEAGGEVSFVRYPDRRGVELVREGEIDAWPKAREWVENPEDFVWSAPLLLSEDVLVSRADRPATFRTISDLFGLRLGTVLGYGYPTLDDAFRTGRIERVDLHDAQTQLEMLDRGRVDAVVMERRIADWALRHTPGLNRDDFRLSTRNVHSVQYRLMFTGRRDWADFVSRFDAAVARMRASGELAALFKKYR